MGPLPVVLPLAMAVVVFFTPSKRWRPRLLAATAAVHFALTLSILAAPASVDAGEWLTARRSRPPPARPGQPALPLLRDLLGRLPALSRRPRQPPLLRLPPGGPGDHEPGRLCAAPGPALGRDGGDDARHGAADLLQPFAALDRGDLEVPGDLVGRHRTGPVRLVLPGLRGAARRRRGLAALPRPARRGDDAVATLAARRLHPAAGRLRHQARAWRPCTPGSPTPTARRPGWSAPCSPAA